MPDAGYANPFMGSDASGGGLYGGLDPLAAGLFAAAQAFAQAGQASRTPQSSLGAFGASAGAFGQGYGTAAAGQRQAAFQGAQMGLLGQQTQGVKLENAAKMLNMPILELKSDIISGKRDPNTFALIGQPGAGGAAPPDGSAMPPQAGPSMPQAAPGMSWGGGATAAAPDMQVPQQGAPPPAFGPVQAQGGQGGPGGVPLPPGWSPRNLMVNQALYPEATKSYLDKYNERFGAMRPGGSVQDQSAPGGWLTAPQPQIAAEQQKQAQEYFNKTGQVQPTLPGASPPGGGGIDPGARLPPGFNPGAQRRSADAAVPQLDANRPPQGAVQSGTEPAAKDTITTPKGTIVPLPTGRQVMGPGSDLIDKQNTESVATEKNWNAVRPAIETSRQRLFASAAAFNQVEGKGLNEAKADASNILRGIPGMGKFADMVMTAPDTTAVKSAIWNSLQETLSNLKLVNVGGRVLNSEFNAFMEKGFSPDMPAATLHNAITAQLGTTYQVGNMIDDYYGPGKQAGWRDANQYQSAYLQKNPIEKFVDYSKQQLGPFKGMPGAPSDRAEMPMPTVPTFDNPGHPGLAKLPKGSAFYDDKGVMRFKP